MVITFCNIITVDIKSLQTIKTAGICDVKKWNKDQSNQNFCTINVKNYSLCNATEKQWDTFDSVHTLL